jgi:hypothetical protein
MKCQVGVSLAVAFSILCKFGEGFTFRGAVQVLTKPNTTRSQLARFLKLLIGQVLWRTSRKVRSMTLVVRTFFRCPTGTEKKVSKAFRSTSSIPSGTA